MTSNFLLLTFSTLYSSSLPRTDTIMLLNLISPLSNVFEITKPPRGLNRGSTVCNLKVKFKDIYSPGGGGGALGYFLGGYVPPRTPTWHPVLKKNSVKIDTPFYKWANFLYSVL